MGWYDEIYYSICFSPENMDPHTTTDSNTGTHAETCMRHKTLESPSWSKCCLFTRCQYPPGQGEQNGVKYCLADGVRDGDRRTGLG